MDASSLPLVCYWHASGLPLEDSVIRPRTAPPQAQCLGGGGLGSCLSGRHVAYCLARGPSGGLPMWAGLFLAAPVRFLRCLHCNRHCGGMRRHCDGTSGCGGTSARKAHRRRYDAPAPLAWDQGEMSSREIAHDSDDGVEQAAQSCEPTATRFRRLRDMLAVPLSSRCWITYIAAARLSPIIHRVRVPVVHVDIDCH